MKTCDYCGKEHNRKRFCCNQHKDLWHNKHNPRGYGARQTATRDDDDVGDYGMGWDEDGWVSDDSGVTVL